MEAGDERFDSAMSVLRGIAAEGRVLAVEPCVVADTAAAGLRNVTALRSGVTLGVAAPPRTVGPRDALSPPDRVFPGSASTGTSCSPSVQSGTPGTGQSRSPAASPAG